MPEPKPPSKQPAKIMPRGEKSSYTSKQKRQAAHIEESYEKRGVSEGEAERRAWATVNKTSGGGKKSGPGRGKKADQSPARKGGRKGGAAAKSRTKKTATRSGGAKSRSTASRKKS
jgi:plasmid stabilization system protein ParE